MIPVDVGESSVVVEADHDDTASAHTHNTGDGLVARKRAFA